MRVADTVAVVTGGASGLGEATVRELVAEGGRAAILDRPGSPGEQVAAELGERVVFTPADVSSEADVKAALEKTVARFGAVHVAVNCAGIGTAMRTVTREGPMRLAIFEKTIAINLIGTFNVIRLAAALMAKNAPNADGERGVIINT